jgi:enoyl-CoA hydratase
MTWEAIHRGMNLTLEESTLLGADYFGLVAATEDFPSRNQVLLGEDQSIF